jgi:hypothetical protein
LSDILTYYIRIRVVVFPPLQKVPAPARCVHFTVNLVKKEYRRDKTVLPCALCSLCVYMSGPAFVTMCKTCTVENWNYIYNLIIAVLFLFSFRSQKPKTKIFSYIYIYIYQWKMIAYFHFTLIPVFVAVIVSHQLREKKKIVQPFHEIILAS